MEQLKELQGSFDDLGSAVRKTMRDLDQIIGKRNIRMLRERGAKNMFKVGQVVRVTRFPKRLWVIKERRWDGNVVIHSVQGSRFDYIDERFLTLIGNNYKPKDRRHV